MVVCGGGLRNRGVGGFELGTDVGMSEAGGAKYRREAGAFLVA